MSNPAEVLGNAVGEMVRMLVDIPEVTFRGVRYPAPGDEIPDQYIEVSIIPAPSFWISNKTVMYPFTVVITLRSRAPTSTHRGFVIAGDIARQINDLYPLFIDSGGNEIRIPQPATVLGDVQGDDWVSHPVEVPLQLLVSS